MARDFGRSKKSVFLRTAAAGAIAALTLASPAQAIVPNDNFTPADISDPEDSVNGVGMFFRNDGFVCSGTLINPRTVLFAAHCVNDRPESDYGPVIRSAFSFNGNALPGFIDWIGAFQSNPDLFVYDIAQIYYNPDSLADPNAFGFLEGDVALAALSDPVASRLDGTSLTPTIPTWALLFSPLPTPAAIDPVTGTGYHVNITGYGRSGSGTTGASFGIDWRRKSAENMLGALTSFDERNQFLFGNPFGDLPQSLYRIDFDDPNKTNPFDFNLYKDEPTVREGTTAGGDSGGPLILDAANNSLSTENLQLSVLSGGSRFFGAQVFSSYGTESFHQPLYLFWDYIAANNPYRYVSAVEGDGAWEDPNHWQTDLDPVYRIIDANGAVVNGIPTSPGAGIDGGSPDFGEVCFDPEGANPGDGCQDLSNGNATPPARETRGNVESGIGQVSADDLSLLTDSAVTVGGTTAQTSDVVEAVAVNEAPAATPELAEEAAQPDTGNSNAPVAATAGSPGARAGMIMGAEHQAQDNGGMIMGGENIAHANGNGVEFAIEAPQTGVELAENQAQDDDGAEIAEEQPQGISGEPPEFAAGPNPAPTLANGLPGATGFVPDNVGGLGVDPNRRYFEVTLSNAGTTSLSSTVTIDKLNIGGPAGLNVTAAGDLTTLIDINQFGGMTNVDGALTTRGDYLLAMGLLSGTGTVTTPFLTSVAGMIAPGTTGTVGTLTVDGNAIMSSGSALLVDIGASGNSDVLAVTGDANLGGIVSFAPVAGFNSLAPSTYTILTNGGTQSGAFSSGQFVSAILQASFTYNPNNVMVTVTTGSYQNAVDPNNPVQVSYAGLMDRNRGVGAHAGLFQTLDFLDAASIQAIFDSWAPTTESTAQTMIRGMLTNAGDFYQNRLANASRSSNGGTIAVIGRPIELAAASLGGSLLSGSAIMSDAAVNAAGSRVTSDGINEDMAVYLAGGYIDGDGRSMPLTNPGPGTGNDSFDGFFIAGGVEYYPSEHSMIGISAYYSDLDANVALGQRAEGRTIMGTIYGHKRTTSNWVFDARISAGSYNVQTLRNVALGPQNFNLTTDDDNFLFASEVGVAKELDLLGAIVAPGIRGRAAHVNFGTVSEAGGGPALTIIRPDYRSIQGLAGVEFKSKQHRKLQARVTMHYVHEFLNNPNRFGANFVGGAGLPAPFALTPIDRNWGELGAGLRYNSGNMSFDLSIDTTVGRADVESQVYSGAVTFRF